MQVTHNNKEGKSVAAIDPDAAEILALYREASEAARMARRHGETATKKAVICGQRLIEKRELLKAGGKSWQGAAKNGDGFTEWLTLQCAEIPHRTAYRWMNVAERVAAKLGLGQVIEIEGAKALPLSAVLGMEAAELPEEAQRYQQQVFDFCAEHSISRILTDDSVDDVAAKRALNGKTKGGTNERDDRKDFPKFIAEHLSDITTLLGGREKDREARWKKFTNGQQERIGNALRTALANWPTGFLETLYNAIDKEMGQR